VTPTPPPQCSIALWQGYVTAQFYARDSNGGVLLLSPAFPTWRFPWQPAIPMHEDPRARAALDALDAELRSRDWVRMRREPGSDWYELGFRLGTPAVERRAPRRRSHRGRQRVETR